MVYLTGGECERGLPDEGGGCGGCGCTWALSTCQPRSELMYDLRASADHRRFGRRESVRLRRTLMPLDILFHGFKFGLPSIACCVLMSKHITRHHPCTH